MGLQDFFVFREIGPQADHYYFCIVQAAVENFLTAYEPFSMSGRTP